MNTFVSKTMVQILYKTLLHQYFIFSFLIQDEMYILATLNKLKYTQTDKDTTSIYIMPKMTWVLITYKYTDNEPTSPYSTLKLDKLQLPIFMSLV